MSFIENLALKLEDSRKVYTTKSGKETDLDSAEKVIHYLDGKDGVNATRWGNDIIKAQKAMKRAKEDGQTAEDKLLTLPVLANLDNMAEGVLTTIVKSGQVAVTLSKQGERTNTKFDEEKFFGMMADLLEKDILDEHRAMFDSCKIKTSKPTKRKMAAQSEGIIGDIADKICFTIEDYIDKFKGWLNAYDKDVDNVIDGFKEQLGMPVDKRAQWQRRVQKIEKSPKYTWRNK